jgi:hypothetical protein
MSNQTFLDQIAKSLHLVGSLEGVPEYAMTLANIVTTWTALEQRFTIAYMVMTGCSVETASVTMHSLSNSHQKFTMLRTLTKRFAPDRKFSDTLIDIITNAEQLAAKRSKYVHRQWIVRGDGQVQLINYMQPEGSQKRTEIVHLEQMTEVLEQTRKLKKRINDLLNPLLQPSP